jgi:hypothetical protein
MACLGGAFKRALLISWTISVCFCLSTFASAQQCKSVALCREARPTGALLHEPNSRGVRIWTVGRCEGSNAPTEWSNTSPRHLDEICQQIASCSTAGAFGKFLQSVTFDCRTKHFDGYFGLDGLTFGILDWTSNNLPSILEAYKMRNISKYEEVFGKLSVPMKGECVDANWICTNNKRGKFICDPDIHRAFKLSIEDAEFQKAQIDVALRQYEARIKRFAGLGLRTEYGNTAMAVVANNLVDKTLCRPASWKATCAGQADETKLVDCMLEQYVSNACRGTSPGSRDRVNAIKKIFAGASPGANIHPTADAIIACSDKWGRSAR